ncbi:MAG: metallophosphoesterase family protein [Chloroflexota bacterium]
MRIALLSDIHGNHIALDAVLADIQSQGEPDAYWVLGDLAALGGQPVDSLERVTALPNVSFVRGNTDRYVTKGDRPPPLPEEVVANPDLLPVLVEVANSFAWTQGMITASGWFDFMDKLPLEQRLTLPDGTRLLGVHASPGTDDGVGVSPDTPEEVLNEMFDSCDADLVCVGHTHWPANRQVGNVHVVNLGSVANPRIPSLEATYVLLDANESGYTITHHFVPYARDAVVQILDQVHHPAAGFIESFMRGEKIATHYGQPDC